MPRMVAIRAIPAGTAVASGGSATSGPCDLRRCWKDPLTLVYQTTGSAPDVKIEYATSEDGITFGGFTDESVILASSNAVTNPQNVHTIDISGIKRAPFLKFKVTGVGSNGANTVVTLDLNGSEDVGE